MEAVVAMLSLAASVTAQGVHAGKMEPACIAELSKLFRENMAGALAFLQGRQPTKDVVASRVGESRSTVTSIERIAVNDLHKTDPVFADLCTALYAQMREHRSEDALTAMTVVTANLIGEISRDAEEMQRHTQDACQYLCDVMEGIIADKTPKSGSVYDH
jgi:hypothetical protein